MAPWIAEIPVALGMTCFSDRLATFHGTLTWPHEVHGPSSADLARAGFFRYGEGEPDEVVCFQCGVHLIDWQSTDTAYDEHFRHSKNCPFVKAARG